MEPFVVQSESHTLHLHQWEVAHPQLVAGFTLRTGGTSTAPYSSCNIGLHVGDDPTAVVANRAKLSERLGFAFEAWTCADQVHGKHVERVTVTRRGAGRASVDDVIPATDGLYTDEAGILLTSFYADCVPLFFFDPTKQVVGLAHAGWKGTVCRISGEMIEAFSRDYGSRQEDILVAIGPSIGGCCYEVDERIIEQVREVTPEWEASAQAKDNGRYMLDLPLLNQLIIAECGIPTANIVRTRHCTGHETDLFFSHRMEGGKTGRMASFIGWREENRDEPND